MSWQVIVSATFGGMFWSTQLGPMLETDIPGERDGRLIGQVVCAECPDTLARMFDGADGVDLYAWMRGQSPANPTSRVVGYLCYAWISEQVPADDEVASLVCWSGHGPMSVTGAECRRAIAKYRRTGKKARLVASRVAAEPTG